MLSNSVRRRGLIVTALVVVAAAPELWALSLPVLKEMDLGLFGGLDAWNFAVRLDLILVVPVAFAMVSWAWSGRPAPRVADVISPSGIWSLVKRYGFLLLVAGLWLLQMGDLGRTLLGLAVAVEVGFFVLLAVKGVGAWRKVVESRKQGYSLTTATLVAVNRAFGPTRFGFAMRLVVTEVALLFHALFAWFVPRRRPGAVLANRKGEEYTLFVGFVIFLFIEAVPVHFLVHHYLPWLAWVLSALSAYSVLWLLGDVAARLMRPSVLQGHRLRLCRGLRLEAVIDVRDVARVREVTEDGVVPDVEFGDAPQLVLELRSPVDVYGWFGTLAQAQTIGVQVDDPDGLREVLSRWTATSRCFNRSYLIHPESL